MLASRANRTNNAGKGASSLSFPSSSSPSAAAATIKPWANPRLEDGPTRRYRTVADNLLLDTFLATPRRAAALLAVPSIPDEQESGAGNGVAGGSSSQAPYTAQIKKEPTHVQDACFVAFRHSVGQFLACARTNPQIAAEMPGLPLTAMHKLPAFAADIRRTAERTGEGPLAPLITTFEANPQHNLDAIGTLLNSITDRGYNDTGIERRLQDLDLHPTTNRKLADALDAALRERLGEDGRGGLKTEFEDAGSVKRVAALFLGAYDWESCSRRTTNSDQDTLTWLHHVVWALARGHVSLVDTQAMDAGDLPLNMRRPVDAPADVLQPLKIWWETALFVDDLVVRVGLPVPEGQSCFTWAEKAWDADREAMVAAERATMSEAEECFISQNERRIVGLVQGALRSFLLRSGKAAMGGHSSSPALLFTRAERYVTAAMFDAGLSVAQAHLCAEEISRCVSEIDAWNMDRLAFMLETRSTRSVRQRARAWLEARGGLRLRLPVELLPRRGGPSAWLEREEALDHRAAAHVEEDVEDSDLDDLADIDDVLGRRGGDGGAIVAVRRSTEGDGNVNDADEEEEEEEDSDNDDLEAAVTGSAYEGYVGDRPPPLTALQEGEARVRGWAAAGVSWLDRTLGLKE